MIPIVFENGFEMSPKVGQTGILDNGNWHFKIHSTNGSMMNPKQIIHIYTPQAVALSSSPSYEINHSAKYEWKIHTEGGLRTHTLTEGKMDIY
jgi:hypothetical protein